MHFESVFRTLNNINPITAEAWDDLHRLLEPVEIGRVEFLVREGDKV